MTMRNKENSAESYKELVINDTIYYGMHALISMQNCSEDITSIEFMKTLLVEIVEKINMTAFKEPMVFRFGEGNQVGLSGVQLIETSLISFHTNDMKRDLYLDVFSCKSFSTDDLEQYLSSKLSDSDTRFELTVVLRK